MSQFLWVLLLSLFTGLPLPMLNISIFQAFIGLSAAFVVGILSTSAMAGVVLHLVTYGQQFGGLNNGRQRPQAAPPGPVARPAGTARRPLTGVIAECGSELERGEPVGHGRVAPRAYEPYPESGDNH